jgi:uroporphyrinogen decarboxylase
MRIPLSLSVYEHAARFVNRTPWDVSRDGDLLYRAHREAYGAYRHTPVIVGIDIYNLEAEAYGCTVVRPSGNGIPAITEPLLTSLDDGLELAPFDPARDGRIPACVEAARRLRADLPDADIRLPVSGPFSVAQNLLGLEPLLFSAISEPDKTRRFLEHLARAQIQFARAVHQAGVGVAFFESSAAPPLLSPRLFRDVELPALKSAIAAASVITGAPVPCIIGGDTAPIVPEMLETGTGFLICPAETDRPSFLRAMRRHPGVTVRVNMKPEIYVKGSRAEIAAAIDAVAALARERKGLLLGTGAIPFETPIDNIRFAILYAGA